MTNPPTGGIPRAARPGDAVAELGEPLRSADWTERLCHVTGGRELPEARRRNMPEGSRTGNFCPS